MSLIEQCVGCSLCVGGGECRTSKAARRQQCCLIGYKAKMNEGGRIFTPAVMGVYLDITVRVCEKGTDRESTHLLTSFTKALIISVISAALAETQPRLSKIMCPTLKFSEIICKATHKHAHTTHLLMRTISGSHTFPDGIRNTSIPP